MEVSVKTFATIEGVGPAKTKSWHSPAWEDNIMTLGWKADIKCGVTVITDYWQTLAFHCFS